MYRYSRFSHDHWLVILTPSYQTQICQEISAYLTWGHHHFKDPLIPELDSFTTLKAHGLVKLALYVLTVIDIHVVCILHFTCEVYQMIRSCGMLYYFRLTIIHNFYVFMNEIDLSLVLCFNNRAFYSITNTCTKLIKTTMY